MFLSSMGLPLLNGFIGEFTILQGTFVESKVWAAWAVPGVVLAAAYLLWLYQRVYFGPVTNPKNEKLQDLTPREVLTFAPLIAAALFIGLYPKPMFQILQQPVQQLVQTVRPGEMKPVLATQPRSSPSAAVVPSAVEGPLSSPSRPASSQAVHPASSNKQPATIAAAGTN
jgi:NADH-quinone oxidoreductase subunit M